MDQFLQRYIELKNAYVRSEGDAASVQVLYEYKDYLEEQTTLEAKWVLVDVCETLELYRTTYETLRLLVTRGDKKAQKRLGRLQGFQEQGDRFALRHPKGGKERARQTALLAGLPFFRYHPNPLAMEAFRSVAPPVTCDCCGKSTHISYDSPFYAVKNIDHLCPACIAGGEAARRFDGAFGDEGFLAFAIMEGSHQVGEGKVIAIEHEDLMERGAEL